MQGGLIYVGAGGFLPGIPARNLTEAEASKFGEAMLLNSGLYVRPTTKDLGGRQNKMIEPNEEDK